MKRQPRTIIEQYDAPLRYARLKTKLGIGCTALVGTWGGLELTQYLEAGRLSSGSNTVLDLVGDAAMAGVAGIVLAARYLEKRYERMGDQAAASQTAAIAELEDSL